MGLTRKWLPRGTVTKLLPWCARADHKILKDCKSRFLLWHRPPFVIRWCLLGSSKAPPIIVRWKTVRTGRIFRNIWRALLDQTGGPSILPKKQKVPRKPTHGHQSGYLGVIAGRTLRLWSDRSGRTALDIVSRLHWNRLWLFKGNTEAIFHLWPLPCLVSLISCSSCSSFERLFFISWSSIAVKKWFHKINWCWSAHHWSVKVESEHFSFYIPNISNIYIGQALI